MVTKSPLDVSHCLESLSAYSFIHKRGALKIPSSRFLTHLPRQRNLDAPEPGFWAQKSKVSLSPVKREEKERQDARKPTRQPQLLKPCGQRTLSLSCESRAKINRHPPLRFLQTRVTPGTRSSRNCDVHNQSRKGSKTANGKRRSEKERNARFRRKTKEGEGGSR